MQYSLTDFDHRYGVLYKEMSLVLIQADQRAELSLSPDSILDGRLRFLADIAFNISKPACLAVQFFGRGFDVDVSLLSIVEVGVVGEPGETGAFKLELKITPEIALKARILLQLAEIVHYRKRMADKGEKLTVDEAAAKWIALYAAGFAEEFDKHINTP